MSTYNGEKFIKEQINSILSQKDVDVCLYIRDDGSSDSTIEIINDYCRNNKNVRLINKPDEKNVGVLRSFLTLLKYVLNENTEFNYFCFADQDDYWKPEKISKALQMLSRVEDVNEPSLYYSNKTFVNGLLDDPRDENIIYYGDFYEGFYGSLAYGCTMVFNRSLAILTASHIPTIKCMHDSWMYRIAKSVHANIFFDKNSYILYRQHENNVVGEDACKPSKYRWSNIIKKREHYIQSFYQEIYDCYNDYIFGDEKKYIELILSYNKSIKSMYELAFDKQAKKRGKKSFILWIAKLVFRTL